MCGICNSSCNDSCKGIKLFSGNDGVGIESITNNNNGTYTFNLTDGNSFTTGDLTGPVGAPGVNAISGNSDQWQFKTGFTPTDGQISFDSSFLNSITKCRISINNILLENVADFISSFENANTSVLSIARFGDIKVFSSSDLNEYVNFKILRFGTSGVDYIEFDIIRLSSSSGISIPFTDLSSVGVTFTPNTSDIDEYYTQIVGWNMDTTNAYNIPIASLAPIIIDHTKIVGVEVFIVNDFGTITFPLVANNGTTQEGTVYSIDNINIRLLRVETGIFNNPVFTGVNASHAVIKYLKH